MNTSRILNAAIVAAAIIGAVGFVSAQTQSPGDPSEASATTTEPAAGRNGAAARDLHAAPAAVVRSATQPFTAR